MSQASPSRRTSRSAGHSGNGPLERLQTLIRDLLPRRRITRSERDAFDRNVAQDPEVEQALMKLLAARPQFGRRDGAQAGVQDHNQR